MRQFFLSTFLFTCLACNNNNGTLSMTINVIGDPAQITTAFAGDDFLIALTEGSLRLRNIDLVSNELDEVVPLIAPGQELDFVTNASFNITPVEVPKVAYQQVRIGLDDTAAVAFNAVGTISINGNANDDLLIEFALPAATENVFNNEIAFDADEVNDTITVDINRLFEGIDFRAITNNNQVIINADNAAVVEVQDALDLYTVFFSEDNADPMFADQ